MKEIAGEEGGQQETPACDLKVAEMIVCRKDQFIRRAVPSAADRIRACLLVPHEAVD